MITYTELSQNPTRFLALTAYTVEEFQALLPHFQARFEQHMQTHTVKGKPRQNRLYTTYRNSPLLTIQDKLLFILSYLKQNATQELHAACFGLHQPDANTWIHLLHPPLNQALGDLGTLPVREATHWELEDEALEVYFHDDTERDTAPY